MQYVRVGHAKYHAMKNGIKKYEITLDTDKFWKVKNANNQSVCIDSGLSSLFEKLDNLAKQKLGQ